MCLLSKEEGTILMADSPAEVVYRLNTKILEYAVVFDDPLLKPVQRARPMFGVNRTHVVDGWLYFSNTNQGILAKVPIASDGAPKGPVSIVSNQVPAADDFAVDARNGSVWLAENVRQGSFMCHLLGLWTWWREVRTIRSCWARLRRFLAEAEIGGRGT